MAKPYKQNIFTVLALSFLAVGCGADKTLDEYNAEKANQELTQNQKAAGSFRGSLLNQSTGQPMGAVDLELQAPQIPVQNGDNTGTTVRSVLQGTVTVYTAQGFGQGSITSASFTKAKDYTDDLPKGTVSGLVSVTVGTQTYSFTIFAGLVGATLTGTITPNQPGVTGSFSATKGAPLPDAGQGSIDPNAPRGIKLYGGLYSDPNSECRNPQFKNTTYCKGVDPDHLKVQMSLNFNPANSGVLFDNLFLNEKTVIVDVEMDNHDYAMQGTAYNVGAGTISFNGTLPGDTATTTFNCNSRGMSTFHCTYQNAKLLQPYSFDVTQTR
jgi:hypothetical protein